MSPAGSYHGCEDVVVRPVRDATVGYLHSGRSCVLYPVVQKNVHPFPVERNRKGTIAVCGDVQQQAIKVHTATCRTTYRHQLLPAGKGLVRCGRSLVES